MINEEIIRQLRTIVTQRIREAFKEKVPGISTAHNMRKRLNAEDIVFATLTHRAIVPHNRRRHWADHIGKELQAARETMAAAGAEPLTEDETIDFLGREIEKAELAESPAAR